MFELDVVLDGFEYYFLDEEFVVDGEFFIPSSAVQILIFWISKHEKYLCSN
jgi:hypothetical protein